MSRSEQVNLWICSVLLWLDIFRIWSQTAYSSLLTKCKVFLKIKLKLNFKMSQTQYEFESYRIFSIDNMHRSCIFLCEKMIKICISSIFYKLCLQTIFSYHISLSLNNFMFLKNQFKTHILFESQLDWYMANFC